MTSPLSSSVPGRRSIIKGLWLWEEWPRVDSTDGWPIRTVSPAASPGWQSGWTGWACGGGSRQYPRARRVRSSLLEVELYLNYTIFAGQPALARSACLKNRGGQDLHLTAAMSLSLDLPLKHAGAHGPGAQLQQVVKALPVPDRLAAVPEPGPAGQRV